MKNKFLILLMLLPGALMAQDTLTLMQYNLLFYGINTSFCNNQNNNVDLKDLYLSNIIDYVQPDIFTVNELGKGQNNVNRILNNVLNADGNERFSAASYTNTTNSNIVNMLFYDHHKFTLYFEAVIANLMRDVNLYTLYYNDHKMQAVGDTIFLTAIVAHLKAGNSAEDQQTRTAEVQTVMAYINSANIPGNLIFMGDFNMNSSYEQAFQYITFHPNEEIRFYDPVNKPGGWYNNPDFAAYHTQSTHTENHDCFVTGGLDDRYDFILVSDAVMQGHLGLKYIEDSYQTLGQDGNRFNQSVIYPPNNSAPQLVIESLYGMSDHLPVSLKLKTGHITTRLQPFYTSMPSVTFNNPVRDILRIQVNQSVTDLTIEIFSLTGRKLISWNKDSLVKGEGASINILGLKPGVYLLRTLGKGMCPFHLKLIKS